MGIQTTRQYSATCERIEELVKIVGNETNEDDKNYIALDLLSDLISEYEQKHFELKQSTLPEVINLRMFEMGLTQEKLSKLLNISPSRVSEYLSGKSEPTLKKAREISKKLNIDADIVLGV